MGHAPTKGRWQMKSKQAIGQEGEGGREGLKEAKKETHSGIQMSQGNEEIFYFARNIFVELKSRL